LYSYPSLETLGIDFAFLAFFHSFKSLSSIKNSSGILSSFFSTISSKTVRSPSNKAFPFAVNTCLPIISPALAKGRLD
jgi:hypothetical protein